MHPFYDCAVVDVLDRTLFLEAGVAICVNHVSGHLSPMPRGIFDVRADRELRLAQLLCATIHLAHNGRTGEGYRRQIKFWNSRTTAVDVSSSVAFARALITAVQKNDSELRAAPNAKFSGM